MEAPKEAECAHCGKKFPQRFGPGRRKDYCEPACRRAAQRLRERQAAEAGRQGPRQAGSISADLDVLTARLTEYQLRDEPLDRRLHFADLIEQEVRCYVFAAVYDARADGLAWRDIASAAGVTEASARSRWSVNKCERVLRSRPVIPE